MIDTVVQGAVGNHGDTRGDTLVHDWVSIFFHELLQGVDTVELVDVLIPVYHKFAESRAGDVDGVLSDGVNLKGLIVFLLPRPLGAFFV